MAAGRRISVRSQLFTYLIANAAAPELASLLPDGIGTLKLVTSPTVVRDTHPPDQDGLAIAVEAGCPIGKIRKFPHLRCEPCMYRKPKPERNGDEVRQGWGVI